jgi:hypothetical protein
MKTKLLNKPQTGALAVGLMTVASYVQACYVLASGVCATAGQVIDMVAFVNNGGALVNFTAATDWDLPLAASGTSGSATFTSLTNTDCAGKATYSYHGGTQTATWWEAGLADFHLLQYKLANGSYPTIPMASTATCS